MFLFKLKSSRWYGKKEVVVVNAVDSAKIMIANGVVVPARNKIGVGVSFVMDILRSLTDCRHEGCTTPIAILLIQARKIITRWDSNGGIAVVVVFSNQKFKVLASIGKRIIVKVFSAQDHFSELSRYRGVLIRHGFVQHVLQFGGIVEAHSAHTHLRQQVVFANFAPLVVIVVIPSAVESAIIQVGRNIGIHLRPARLYRTIETAIGHQIHIASQQHHDDTLALVFGFDIITDFLLIVTALGAGDDVFQRIPLRS